MAVLSDRQPQSSQAAPAAPASADSVAVPAEAAPVAAPAVALLREDELARQNAQPGPAPRELSPEVAAQLACNGSPVCRGMTNGTVEQLARDAEGRGDYAEAARLRAYLPAGAQ